MTRQIALGAVISFAITVLVLSVWEPKVPAPAAPVPPPAAEARPIDPLTFRQNLRPAALRPEALGRTIRQGPPVVVLLGDAGAPLP